MKIDDVRRKHVLLEVKAELASRSQRQVNELQEALEEEKEARRKSERRRRQENGTWQRKLEELQRKAERSDQAHFGPEGEEDLAKVLSDAFRGDQIRREGRGGDVIQDVVEHGRVVATIVWERKNTADWKSEYVKQLKRAMDARGTRYGILVSNTLPSGESGFCVVGDVPVVAPDAARHVGSIVRAWAVDLARSQLSEADRESKTRELYDYMRGDEFGDAVRAIREKAAALQEELRKERAAHELSWKRRHEGYEEIAQRVVGVDQRVKDILAGKPGAQEAA